MARTSRNKMFAPAAAIAASALLLAGCAVTAADAHELEWTPGPLDEFSARIHGFSLDSEGQQTQQEAQAEIDANGRIVEELTAACMAELGFNYIPRDSDFGTIIMHDDLAIDWGSLEFAETYGLGIANNPFWPEEDLDHTHEEFYDPNNTQLEAMSEAEREAWQEALWGAPQYGDEWDPALAGCAGAAQEHTWGMEVDDQFAALNDEMNRFWETVQADPRVARLHAEWSACMADAGFPGLANTQEMHDSIHAEWSDLQGWNNDFDWENWDWEAEPNGPVIPEPSAAEVAAFADREIALAVANYHCRANYDYDQVFMTVHHDLQQQFVDRHGAELEAWATFEEARRDG